MRIRIDDQLERVYAGDESRSFTDIIQNDLPVASYENRLMLYCVYKISKTLILRSLNKVHEWEEWGILSKEGKEAIEKEAFESYILEHHDQGVIAE
jgi:hypothetical protein